MNQLTTMQKTALDTKVMQSLFLLGIATTEYLEAELKTSKTKDKYVYARDKFIKENFDEFSLINWSEIIINDDFLDATGFLYAQYKDAKRIQHNAKRRMETKFRQYKLALARSTK